ncbi:nitroreductase family protein [Roseomonas sp. E05]|uniref:nitroreductase family protein n=1 Tax=Roseomonas sp. E05 TaxID=3046310 RepID=UPI0024B8AB3F|nr:nitroreductase family protein [Roseomonas sp. E05]MDJ0387740.1 nitroreductase family protein [Roseomonas sp. E05]
MSIDQHEALAARYGAAALPPAGPWNDVIAALMAHRSVRAYRSDPLPEGTLETLVAAAQSAATSSNMQTWSVVAVTDPARKAVFAEVANNQRHIIQCPLFLVWLADLSRNARLAEAEGTTLEALPYFETFLVAALDAALAAQNATVAAESLGLSTVYIGALRNDVRRVAAELALPPGVVGVFGLCVGYADPAARAEVKPRLPQGAILHREQYDAGAETEMRGLYDVALSEFSARNEMKAYRWTDRVLARLGRISALHGRDGLKAALRDLGFPLK